MDHDIAAGDRDLGLTDAAVRADPRCDRACPHREAELADPRGVADRPVDHRSRKADRFARRRHELAEERAFIVTVARDDEHVAGFRFGERLVDGDDASWVAEDREGRSGDDGTRHATLDVGMHHAE